MVLPSSQPAVPLLLHPPAAPASTTSTTGTRCTPIWLRCMTSRDSHIRVPTARGRLWLYTRTGPSTECPRVCTSRSLSRAPLDRTPSSRAWPSTSFPRRLVGVDFCKSHFNRHTSHVTRHTSLVTHHTSLVTRHTPLPRTSTRPPRSCSRSATR